MRPLLALLVVLVHVAAARAQCTPQWTTGGPLPGVDGQIYCSTVWGSSLVVGGNNIALAGDAFVRNIAAFDGTSWHALGPGIAAAYHMTTYNGELIVAGSIDTGSGNSVPGLARWNGQTWSQIPGLEAAINDMTVFNGELIVAGHELTINGVSVPHLVAWNGSSWRALAGQPQGNLHTAWCLWVHNNELIVGGRFSAIGTVAAANIAAFNGITWRALGAGVSNTSNPNGAQVFVLATYNNELIAGGDFLSAGSVTAYRIAKWNGTAWQAMGSGFSNHPQAMAAHGTELFVSVGSDVQRWNGTSWLNSGGLGASLSQPSVSTLSEFQGSMYLGGNVNSSMNTPLNSIARWDGSGWVPVGVGWAHGAGPMVVYNGEAIVQGYYNRPGNTPIQLGAWNGASLRHFTSAASPGFFAMTIYQGQLIGAGSMNSSSSAAVWRWTGAFWDTFAPSMGSAIYALAVYNNQVIAGGIFPGIGSVGPSRIARWDGTVWRPLGSGMQGGNVQALLVYNGDLIAGGSFGSAGDVPNTARLARWNGTEWSSMAAGATIDQVSALGVFNGELIAAGVSPPDRPASRIARWDGSSWRALGAGPAGTVWCMTVFQNELLCGGSLDFGTNGTWTLARWNGSYWKDPGGSPGGHPDYQRAVYRILPFGNELLVGGDFKVIPGPAPGVVASGFARWRCTGVECYANCDNSGVPPILNSNDFQCFLNRFAVGNAYANCDGSAAPPMLNINDFQCFLNKFAVGCL